MQDSNSSAVEFIDLAMESVRGRQYSKALTSMSDGIDSYLQSHEEIQDEEFLKKLKVLLAYLEFRLAEDFGSEWEVEHQEEETVLRCSFCGEQKSENRRMVAGPGVVICNECAKACVEILTSNS
jgi:formylmethanofuran dehydrogenase subunit E